MDAACRALEMAGKEQEKAEMELKKLREAAHQQLEKLKTLYNDCKEPIKRCFIPEQWAKFGLPDKR